VYTPVADAEGIHASLVTAHIWKYWTACWAALEGVAGCTTAATTCLWWSMDAPVLCLDSAPEISWHNTMCCGLNQVSVQGNQVYTINGLIPTLEAKP